MNAAGPFLTAIHEAGHAIVGWLLGVKIVRLALNSPEEGKAGHASIPGSWQAQMQIGAEMLIAGPLAELIHQEVPREGYAARLAKLPEKHVWFNDVHDFRECVSQTDVSEAAVIDAVHEKLLKHWSGVCEAACELLAQTSITDPSALEALRSRVLPDVSPPP